MVLGIDLVSIPRAMAFFQFDILKNPHTGKEEKFRATTSINLKVVYMTHLLYYMSSKAILVFCEEQI